MGARMMPRTSENGVPVLCGNPPSAQDSTRRVPCQIPGLSPRPYRVASVRGSGRRGGVRRPPMGAQDSRRPCSVPGKESGKRAAGTEVPLSREKPLKEGPARRHGRRNRPESGEPLKERPTSGNLLEKSAPLSGTLFPSSSLPSCDAFPRRALSLPPHTFLRHPFRILPCVFPFLFSTPPVSVMKSSQRACRR